MSNIDWIVLLLVLSLIIIYGVWKGRGQTGADSYLRAGKSMPWYMVLLGIMATQASAITFISGPGQAYADGMRFVQYYFGLPLAMIVISAVFVPIFQKLNVYTAYQYLDKRFNKNTRLFTGILFLFSRGISTGMSVYAPAIVLSAIFGWNIYLSNILVGGLLIVYTYGGGAKAIAHTQKIQFSIILAAMAVAGIIVVWKMPEGVGFGDALYLAGKSGKLNVITTNFDWNDKYNIWSGVIGGFFLALSYFGTDQSQVGRYLTAKNTRESRMGLLINGMVKIPMQFSILLIGALLFAFYALHQAPLSFNKKAEEVVAASLPESYEALSREHAVITKQQQEVALKLTALRHQQQTASDAAVEQQYLERYHQLQTTIDSQRTQFGKIIESNKLPVEAKDTNYIFLHFVQHYLPVGMIGLLFAVVFLASWGSISAALNSLASSTLIDFHMVLSRKQCSPAEELRYGRLYTLIWGLFSIAVAMFATRMGSLIEAVNELGSLFYGAILGIFLTAFFLKKVQGRAVFYAAIGAEILVLIVYKLDLTGFLWLNVIGALSVMALAICFQLFLPKRNDVV